MWGERGPNDHRGWCCWRGVRALHGLAWPYSLMDVVGVAVTVTVGVWFVFRWASVGRDALRSWNMCPIGGGRPGAMRHTPKHVGMYDDALRTMRLTMRSALRSIVRPAV